MFESNIGGMENIQCRWASRSMVIWVDFLRLLFFLDSGRLGKMKDARV